TRHDGPVDGLAIRAWPTIVVADSSQDAPARSSGQLESRHQVRVANMRSKIEAQALGVGVGFVPLHLAADLLESGALVALPCAIPRPPIPIYMAWRQENHGRALAWFVGALGGIDWQAIG